MKTYRDLDIFQISYDLAIRLHRLSLKLPRYELHEEGSQARRSSKSITSCIVEGYGRRKYKADFMRFLVYAHASCDETIIHLNFMKDTHHAFQQEILDILEGYDELGKKLNKFIQYVEKEWK